MSNINHFIDECVYCEAEFTVTTEDDDEVVFCPFCGEELVAEFDDEEDDDLYDDEDWDE